jgi:hypothetical protein
LPPERSLKMSFKPHVIGQSKEITSDFLNSMARNDDVNKAYYETSSYGILGWFEAESNIVISAFDPESLQSNGEDPNWPTVTSLTIYPENNRVIKMSFMSLLLMQEAPSNASNNVYNQGINIRFLVEYPDDASGLNTSVIPYRYVAPGGYISANAKKEMGALFGHSICIATNDNPNTSSTNYPLLSTPPYNTFIKPKKVKVNLQIRRLNLNQTIVANAESKMQVLIQDIGEWRQ